jgi:hypothetical protein
MSKEQLNVALTPFMGGFTKSRLQDIRREDLVRMLMEAIERASSKKKKNPANRLQRENKDAAINAILEWLQSKGADPKKWINRGKMVGIVFTHNSGRERMLVRSDSSLTIYAVGGAKRRISAADYKEILD